MPHIMIENMFKMSLVASDYSKTLLRHFQDHRLDWMHACGGKGKCTTCRVTVVEGEENFLPLTSAERKYREIGALPPGQRLACQARIRGNVRLLVPHECKLPHVRYSDDNTP